MSSNEPAAPRGQYVERIWEGGDELDLADSHLDGKKTPLDPAIGTFAGHNLNP